MAFEEQTCLEKYLDLLERIKTKVKDEQTAVIILTEISKDRRMEEMRQQKGGSKNNGPATEKQLGYLKKLGIDLSQQPNLTRAEASALIDKTVAAKEAMDY